MKKKEFTQEELDILSMLVLKEMGDLRSFARERGDAVKQAIKEEIDKLFELYKKLILKQSIMEKEIRRCDHCGKPMKEGYYLAGEFACSDECCLALYDGDEAQMKEDLSHAEEIDCETYWTEWDSIYFD